jgi:hypothetical protein
VSLFSPSTPNSAQSTTLYGYPIQTSIYGRPMTLLYGTNRLSGDVIGVYGWFATPVTSGGKGGGKGAGGGGKFGGGNGNNQFTYSAAVQIGLCQGPIVGIGNIWQDKTVLRTAVTNERTSEIQECLGLTRILPTQMIHSRLVYIL